ETLDLLGMTSYLGGDLIGGTPYYQQAVALFDELGNREGLTSSLATLTMRASTYHTDALIAVASLVEVLPYADRGGRVARDVGPRSGDALTLLDSYGYGLSRLRLYPVARLCSRRGATSHCAQPRHSHTNAGAAHALVRIRGTGACTGTSDPCLRNYRSAGCFRCTGR